MKTVIMATLIIILGFVSAGGAEAKPAAGTVLYVSTVGSDDWSGRLPSPNGSRTDGPLASLDKTRAVVRKIAAKGLTEPLTVLIRGGEYFLDSTLVFGPEDSGTATCPITYKAYPNEKPVFSGAKQLKEWTRCSEEIEGLPARRSSSWPRTACLTVWRRYRDHAQLV